ncbi:MAG: hypothetical protein ABI221_03890 [Candidatus Saccharimonadales bacterium]
MKYTKHSYKKLFGAFILLAGLAVQLFALTSPALAAASTTTVRFDRIATSTATTGTVCFTPATAASATTTRVTFPTGYTLGSAANFTTSTTNLAWPTGGTAWPGIGTATTVSGQVVTFPSTTLTVGTLYCFNWTNTAAVTTAASASNANTGTVATYTVTPTLIDTGSFTTSTVTNDQIVVSATIPAAFSFALSGNTDPLGALSTSAVVSSPSPQTVTINTNAKNGWSVWAKDSNTGLNSASAAATIASTTPGSNSTLVAGTAGYNTGITSSQTSGLGTITVASPFVGGSTGKGGGLNTSLATLASSNGSGSGSVLTLTNNVAINATTPAAADYTDTITITGAGLF